jgi:hypothetical protein
MALNLVVIGTEWIAAMVCGFQIHSIFFSFCYPTTRLLGVAKKQLGLNFWNELCGVSSMRGGW